MRAALASIRALIPLLPAALLAATPSCAASAPRTPIGMSDAVPERAAPAVVEAPRAVWAELETARAWPEAAPAFVATAHHRDGSLLHVRVEPAFVAAYRELTVDSPMPDGARVVAWHESTAGALLGGYLLVKRGGNWSAEELDARGALIPGDHAACIRCHDMAPTDHLFGPRRNADHPALQVSGESIDPQRR